MFHAMVSMHVLGRTRGIYSSQNILQIWQNKGQTQNIEHGCWIHESEHVHVCTTKWANEPVWTLYYIYTYRHWRRRYIDISIYIIYMPLQIQLIVYTCHMYLYIPPTKPHLAPWASVAMPLPCASPLWYSPSCFPPHAWKHSNTQQPISFNTHPTATNTEWMKPLATLYILQNITHKRHRFFGQLMPVRTRQRWYIFCREFWGGRCVSICAFVDIHLKHVYVILVVPQP